MTTDEANAKISTCIHDLSIVIQKIEQIVDKGKYVCEQMGWDEEVFWEIDEAGKKAGYALASLTTWDEDIESVWRTTQTNQPTQSMMYTSTTYNTPEEK